MKPRRTRRLARAAIAVLAPLAAWLIRALAVTWRVRFEGPDPFVDLPPVGAIWHCNLFVVAGVFRDSGFTVPVSRSQDGDLIVAVMLRLGLAPPPRGSSKRGGASALRGLVRMARDEGRVVAILTDGPTGPAGVSKPGVIQLGRLAQRPIVPVAFAARPGMRFGSWDRILLPLPFARVVCRFGEPLLAARSAGSQEIEALRAELDVRLGAMTEALEAHVSGRAAGGQ